MSVDLFLTLLVSSTIGTILLTGTLKRFLNTFGKNYKTNAIVLDSAMVSCTGICVLYRLPFGLGFEPMQVIRLIYLIFFTWLLSMYLYDKLRQFDKQREDIKFKEMLEEYEKVNGGKK